MNITINTDASFSRKHGRGTYAFWIICNEYKITMSGVLKNKISRPEIAEFQCIINALYLVFNTPTKNKITKIFLNTDCLNVISIVTRDKEKCKRYGLNKWGHNTHEVYQKLFKEHGFKRDVMDYRHIKSHQHTDTKANYVNQWCDDNAKLEMNKLLLTLKKK